jgi:hypothetical protein
MTSRGSLAEVGSSNSSSINSGAKYGGGKGGGAFDNLTVPFGMMLMTNNHHRMQKYAIDLNSTRTMDIKDPLYDTLLDKMRRK